jgi:hypothetical protein
MLPQYLARQTSFDGMNESFLTQHSHFDGSRYVSPSCSGMITTGRIHVTDTSYRRQTTSQGGVLSGTSNWRNRCRRTSRACWFLAWLSSWQPARSRKKKNSSLSRPRPSRWNRATQANTSKHQSGPAARLLPLPVLLQASQVTTRRTSRITGHHFSVKKYRKSSVYFRPEVQICINSALYWPLSAFPLHCRPVVALQQNPSQSTTSLSMTNTVTSLTTAADASEVRQLRVPLRPIACRPRPLTANPNPMAAAAVQRVVASRVPRRAADPAQTGLCRDAVPGQLNPEVGSC